MYRAGVRAACSRHEDTEVFSATTERAKRAQHGSMRQASCVLTFLRPIACDMSEQTGGPRIVATARKASVILRAATCCHGFQVDAAGGGVALTFQEAR